MRRFLPFTMWSLAWMSGQGQAVSLQHPFPVFDATNFAQEPDLSQYGLKRMPEVYPAYMWDSKEPSVQTKLPDRDRVTAFAQLAAQSSNIVVIDIEKKRLANCKDILVMDNAAEYTSARRARCKCAEENKMSVLTYNGGSAGAAG